MQAMRTFRRYGALLSASVILVAVLGAAVASAQTTTTPTPTTGPALPTPTTVAANTPGTLPDGDDVPSCSLFPTRLAFAQWFFTNRRDFPITLQIVTTSTGGLTGPIGTQIVVFDGTLGGGQSTPIFTLTPDTVIHWAGGTYRLSAYDFVNCLVEEGNTTTTGTIPTQFTVPTTPSTVPTTVPPTTPFSVPTTVPPTTPFSVPTTVPPTAPRLTTPSLPSRSEDTTPATFRQPDTPERSTPAPTPSLPTPSTRPPLVNTGAVEPGWLTLAGFGAVLSGLVALLTGFAVARKQAGLPV